MLPGAAEVRVFGERLPSMRIYVDRDKLAAYGLTVQDVEASLRSQNVEIPAGRIESRAREFSVVSSTDLQTTKQFENVIVANVKGYPVRLRDVARIEIGAAMTACCRASTASRPSTSASPGSPPPIRWSCPRRRARKSNG